MGKLSLFDRKPLPTPRPNKGGRPIEPHRTEKVLADTEFVRLKTQKMRGELVDAADVERAWTGALADLRRELLALPNRIGAELGLDRATVAAIDTRIRSALLALSVHRRNAGAGGG